MSNTKRSNKSGFTLTEMMAVVGIIATMSAVILVGLNGYKVKSRTNRAIADLTAVRGALEDYYVKNGSYPITTGGAGAWDGYCSAWGDSLGTNWIPALAGMFPTGMPFEPRSKLANACVNNTRQYVYRSDGSNYKLINVNVESMNVPAVMIDPIRPAVAYGFWTEGGRAF